MLDAILVHSQVGRILGTALNSSRPTIFRLSFRKDFIPYGLHAHYMSVSMFNFLCMLFMLLFLIQRWIRFESVHRGLPCCSGGWIFGGQRSPSRSCWIKR